MAVDGGMLERKRWWGLVREGSRQRRCQDGWIRRPLTLPRISPPLHADPSMGGVDLGTMAAEWRRGGGGVGAGEGMGSMMATDQLSFGRIRLLGLKILFFLTKIVFTNLTCTHVCKRLRYRMRKCRWSDPPPTKTNSDRMQYIF